MSKKILAVKLDHKLFEVACAVESAREMNAQLARVMATRQLVLIKKMIDKCLVLARKIECEK